MSPEDFKNKISNLPSDTPLTVEHLLSIISTLDVESKVDNNYSQWDKDKLINQKVLAEWLGESESTIEKWRRKKGDGPDPIFKKGKISYRVGTVREWLEKQTYGSIGEYKAAQRKQKMEKLGLRTFSAGGVEYEFDSVFPSISINDIAYPFFETIREDEADYDEMNITGYEVMWTENNSLSSIYLSNLELDIDSELLIKQFSGLKANGTDLNSLQTILINGDIQTINLSHLIASKPYKDEALSALLIGLSELGLDFNAHDKNGLTSLDVSKNPLFNKVIESITFHNQLKIDTALSDIKAIDKL